MDIGPLADKSVRYAPRAAGAPQSVISCSGSQELEANARTRALLKVSLDLFDDVSPELLAYEESGNTRFGLNLTKGIGQAVVAYLEWAGGERASLAQEAFLDGRRTGVLPPTSVIPVSATRRFSNDLAVGAAYTTRLGITFDVEYEHHQAAFDRADWRNWFNVGSANSSDQLVLGQLWFIRGYAGEQQEPMARNSLFLRPDGRDAFVRDLELSCFVDADLRDGSGLTQLAADYFLSPQWTIGGLADLSFGGRRSDLGSLPESANAPLKVARYF